MTSNILKFSKALQAFLKTQLTENDSDIQIEYYELHNDGILIQIDSVQYFATLERLSELSMMEQDEYLKFFKSQSEPQRLAELESFFQTDELTADFISQLESHIEQSVELYLTKESARDDFQEFKADALRYCIFTKYERVNSSDFPEFDIYNKCACEF